MAVPSIDNPFAINPQWWGQRVLPAVAPDPIPVGGSLNFVFPAPPREWSGSQTNWLCTLHVVKHRGGPDIITPRVIGINAQDGLYTGILTTDETASLEDGKYYFLVAIFTAPDKEIDMFVRFKVKSPWVVNL